MAKKKLKMDDFMRAMGRLPDEDFVTTDEFYQMFNAVLDGIKAANIKNGKSIAEIEKVASKEAKKLEKHFKTLLVGVDNRIKKIKDGKDGKDGATPVAGVDYPDYQEIRDFIKEYADKKLPEIENSLRTLADPYQTARGLENLEENERLSVDALNGLDERIDTQMRLFEANLMNKPQFVHGGVNVSGGGGSGVSTFLALTDTPSTFTANQYVKVNAAGDALEYGTPAGSGDVVKVGTPVNNQVGVWTGDGTIEGDVALTFDTTSDTLAIGASGNLAFGAVTVLDDNAGTMTLQNIDAIDATTEATLEAALDFQLILAEGAFVDGDKTKLDGIEDGAEVNNISDANATDLTDGGDSTLHYHATDRARANHTGTQTASTISDFDTEVSNNTDVAANTSARHDAVTVSDSAEIDFTLTGQQISASIKAGSIDETKLDTSINASLDLADSAVQDSSVDTLTNKTIDADNNTISNLALGSEVSNVAPDHGTATTDEVVNVCYGTSATPPTASTTTEGALYIQYTA